MIEHPPALPGGSCSFVISFLASRSRTGLFMVLFFFGHVQRNRILAFLFLSLTQSVEAMFSFLAVAVLCFRRWAGFQLPHFLRLFEFFGAHHPENDFGGTLFWNWLLFFYGAQVSTTSEQALQSLLVAFRIARHFHTCRPQDTFFRNTSTEDPLLHAFPDHDLITPTLSPFGSSPSAQISRL